MTPREVWAVGCGQLVNWGVLYYAFSVLLVPVEQSLGAARWLVAGAFSLALLVSAAAAPAVGRLADRGQGPAVMQAGGLVAAGLLVFWAAVPSIWTLYLVWAGLGLCMAAILYEPVFAIVGRAFTEADARLRAIATVTVMGGLASTAFLPATAQLLSLFGWRGAVVTLAVTIAVTTVIVARLSFRNAVLSRSDIQAAIFNGPHGRADAGTAPGLPRLVAMFAVSSMVSSALASNLVAALIDRRLSPTSAATMAGLFGVMQLPGRVLMTSASFAPHPQGLLLTSVLLQMAGLLALMAPATMVAPWLGVMIFAGGAGLTTLARPYLVLHLYGAERAGRSNAAIATGQQLARALGPVGAAALAGVLGYSFVFGMLAALLAAVTLGLAMKGRNQSSAPTHLFTW
jgi:MFS family permease